MTFLKHNVNTTMPKTLGSDSPLSPEWGSRPAPSTPSLHSLHCPPPNPTLLQEATGHPQIVQDSFPQKSFLPQLRSDLAQSEASLVLAGEMPFLGVLLPLPPTSHIHYRAITPVFGALTAGPQAQGTGHSLLIGEQPAQTQCSSHRKCLISIYILKIFI